jgi:hypothetical protein
MRWLLLGCGLGFIVNGGEDAGWASFFFSHLFLFSPSSFPQPFFLSLMTRGSFFRFSVLFAATMVVVLMMDI